MESVEVVSYHVPTAKATGLESRNIAVVLSPHLMVWDPEPELDPGDDLILINDGMTANANGCF
jgi:hypothetical protein